MSHHLDEPRSLGRTSTAALAALALLLSAGCASAPRPLAASASSSATSPSRQVSPSSNLSRTFEEAVARGDDAWRNGQTDMAVYQYIQALSFKPREIDTLCKLGAIEQAQGNLDLAARAFELAANTDPGNARVTATLGQILLTLRQDDRAQTWLQRSADAHSANWRVYDGLGVLAQRRGDNAAALEYFRQAATMAPSEPMPQLHRGQAMLKSGDKAGAETSARVALTHGDIPEAHHLLGQIQAERHDYTASIDTLLHVADPPTAYSTVAQMALDNGDNAVALDLFEKAARTSPVYSAETQRNAAIARERLSASNQ